MEETKVTVDMLRDVGAKLAEMDGAEDSMKALMALIEAPDDQFETIAPGVLESYRHTLNNPNSQLLMRQALMTTGVSMEEFYKKPVTYREVLWESLFVKNYGNTVNPNLALKLMESYAKDKGELMVNKVVKFAFEEYTSFLDALAGMNSEKTEEELEIIEQ
jgi:hypothetical protein